MNALVSACVLASAVLLGACGSINLQCGSHNCTTGGKTYQGCVSATGTVTYTYASSSCDCSSTNSAACNACLAAVDSYCTGGLTTNGDAGTTDSGTTACDFNGTFTSTTGTGGMAVLTTDANTNFTLVITTANGTINIQGHYSVSGTQVTMTNTASSPSSVQGCIGQAAVYGLTWTSDCSKVTFAKISDVCTGRIADANGTTLTRK